ncbi:TPA: DNA topoisomerase III [Vibrio cholerae]|nr:DNA topoisomerase III [Vibrio cholerae]
MNLYICEKPSLARALFSGLGGNDNLAKQQQRNGFFEVGDNVVTFCSGHMLELLDPEDFDEKYKEWKMSLLPFRFPIKHKIKKDAIQQYSVISSLIKKATVIYNVGDPDEEGQLLVDEILTFENNKKPVKRIFIADYNTEAVKKSLSKITDNKLHEKDGYYALARSVSDQLFGYNLTRAYTLAARIKGYDGVLNIGRVQTAIVHLIDERCKAVENHKESFYYNVIGQFEFCGVRFSAKYRTNDSDITNDKGQLIDEKYSKSLAEKCNGVSAQIMAAKHGETRKLAPMPYTLATLQSDCARKFGATAMEVLESAQALYEKHKVLTYPRSNCSYLGTDHFSARHSVLKAIAQTNPVFTKAVGGATEKEPHRCFNSEKVGAHHGIIPTATSVNLSQMTDLEQKIYNLVARSYIALLYPAAVYAVSELDIKSADLHFSCGAETRIFDGWWNLYKNDTDNPDLQDETETNNTLLSSIKKGDHGICATADVERKKAPAPKYYVESTLLRDLTHVAKYISNPELRDVMNSFFKEKGIAAELGTEATRASVVEKVFDSGLCVKVDVKGYKEKAMMTSEIGKQLMSILPDQCKKVDVTAQWVKMGIDVKSGVMTVDDYINAVYSYIQTQVEHVKKVGIDLKIDLPSCSVCFDGYLKLKKFGDKTFFGCTNYPDCTATYPEYKGQPYTQEHNCPDCGKPLVLRKGKDGYWFGCTGFNEGCKLTMGCVGGKPAKKAFSSKGSSKTNFKSKTKTSPKRTGSILRGKQ